MAAIQASYTFTPALPNGSTITVSGNTESEVKQAVKAALLTKQTSQQTGLAAIEQAVSEMDQ
jgi:hypothetical protein